MKKTDFQATVETQIAATKKLRATIADRGDRLSDNDRIIAGELIRASADLGKLINAQWLIANKKFETWLANSRAMSQQSIDEIVDPAGDRVSEYLSLRRQWQKSVSTVGTEGDDVTASLSDSILPADDPLATGYGAMIEADYSDEDKEAGQ